ncbi:MAG: hypothetical protein P4L69_10985 [Desulfosporosinus sp.]|nr:hypothetical protein [Desulfosporosinus sp.]
MCEKQARFLRGKGPSPLNRDAKPISEDLVTETEKQSVELLARINELGLLSFFGQMGECKVFSGVAMTPEEARTLDYYAGIFYEFVHPVANYDSMTPEEQDASLRLSNEIFREEMVSLTLKERYWITGITRSTTAMNLMQSPTFGKDPKVTIRTMPFGKYVWESMYGKEEDIVEPIGEGYTMLALQTKTKGSMDDSGNSMETFPNSSMLGRIAHMLKKDSALRFEVFQNWCFIMIEYSDLCVNLAGRLVEELDQARNNQLPTKIKRS